MTDASDHRLYAGAKNALVGGAVAALVMAGVALVVGGVSGGEAEVLLEATLPTTRFFCSAAMTTSATTLALMLTLLGLSVNSDRTLKAAHYRRIRQIALVDVLVFAGATVLLLAHAVPFDEGAEVPAGWYTGIYYTFVGASALVGGTLVSVMGMLYGAVRDLIATLGPGGASPLAEGQEGGEASGA